MVTDTVLRQREKLKVLFKIRTLNTEYKDRDSDLSAYKPAWSACVRTVA